MSIVIGHGAQFDEYTTVYMHVEPVVIMGQAIDEKGQIIATVSNISGYHLHLK
jgi:hypothetical protein